MTCFGASLNMALEWYITFKSNRLMVQKLWRGETVPLKKGPRRLPRYPP